MRREFNRPMSIETREDGGRRIAGYAAVYYRADDPGTEFHLGESVIERFLPGAFDSVPDSSVIATFNHDPNQVLGRTPTTLKLRADDVGLRYEIDLPETQLGRDVGELVARGDLRGASVTMKPSEVTRNYVDGVFIRGIVATDVIELGPVTMPAYEATSAEMRSIELDMEKSTRAGKVADVMAKLDK